MCLSLSRVTHIHRQRTVTEDMSSCWCLPCPSGPSLMLGNEWQLLLIVSSERPNTFLNVFTIINLVVVLLVTLIHVHYHLAPLI